MKISYSWIKEHINLDLSSDELAEILTSIGLEVESITKSSNIVGDLEGCLLYTSPSPRDLSTSRMPSSA